MLVATVTDDLIKEKGLKAGALVGSVAKIVGGGGGGQPSLATAGGKNPEKLDDALHAVTELVVKGCQ
jgi:alanyl-tRNA synthetase